MKKKKNEIRNSLTINNSFLQIAPKDPNFSFTKFHYRTLKNPSTILFPTRQLKNASNTINLCKNVASTTTREERIKAHLDKRTRENWPKPIAINSASLSMIHMESRIRTEGGRFGLIFAEEKRLANRIFERFNPRRLGF